MPAKKQITKEAVLETAFSMIRESGIGALNARDLAKKLSCSTQPIYQSFSGMEKLKAALVARATSLYRSYCDEEECSGRYPAFKASGMAYIRFAAEERELFKLLFMRDRSKEDIPPNEHNLDELIVQIQQLTGLDETGARLFHLEIWMITHGIATIMATAYLPFDLDLASRMLTDTYQGLLKQFNANPGKEQTR